MSQCLLFQVVQEVHQVYKIRNEKDLKNSKLNGPSKIYYDNGNVMIIINFKDDEPIGEAIFYDEDGKVVEE